MNKEDELTDLELNEVMRTINTMAKKITWVLENKTSPDEEFMEKRVETLKSAYQKFDKQKNERMLKKGSNQKEEKTK